MHISGWSSTKFLKTRTLNIVLSQFSKRDDLIVVFIKAIWRTNETRGKSVESYGKLVRRWFQVVSCEDGGVLH